MEIKIINIAQLRNKTNLWFTMLNNGNAIQIANSRTGNIAVMVSQERFLELLKAEQLFLAMSPQSAKGEVHEQQQ